ncbi:hypothetical protein [Streptomyces sp. ME19-01-6]|uniref:hypothetical protein n=1 Tax=Streptomyces sp. ME19-01-6 TaxID=3028686 RepID=UPI0029CA11A3|nr:hypothetical protein [Streptomyces sp. ME19-01-6]
MRDAGASGDLEDRAQVLHAEISVAGLTSAQATLELTVCFHHAIQGAEPAVAASISRLRDLTQGGYYAYYLDIAHFMADQPLNDPAAARWIDGDHPTRRRWRAQVTTRQEHLRAAGR